MSFMNFAESQAVACSAPGKVLLAGGYLVLDRNHTGLVFGLDARIHVLVQHLPESEELTSSDIIVRSPQFEGAEWRYKYEHRTDGAVEVRQILGRPNTEQSENRFVQTTLTYALTYASCLYGSAIQPALFTILADSDYYSNEASGGAWQSTRFHNFNVPLSDAHKTGLGSSAALVTAFATAAIAYFVPLSLRDAESNEGRTRLHNLAQAAHCAAQGKIGSGFDVAAAVYGSSIYRRFSPHILEVLGDEKRPAFAKSLQSIVEDTNPLAKWDTIVEKEAAIIPKGLLLVMCDVDCGSETVGMVKSVLEWRKRNAEAAAILWSSLQAANEDLATKLQRLATRPVFPPEDIESLRVSILTIRSLLRGLSEDAGVPIEPPVQTALIDACSQLPGVIGGVVPGAGGYDAVALLIEDKAEVIRDLRSLLAEHQASSTGEAGVRIGRIRLLGVKQEMQGLRIEDSEEYEAFLQSL